MVWLHPSKGFVHPTLKLPWTLSGPALPTRAPRRETRRAQERVGDAGVFLMLSLCRRDGGANCVGPARSHRTCHTEVQPANPSLLARPSSLTPSSCPAFHLPGSEGEHEASPGTRVGGTEVQDPRAPGHGGWIGEDLNLPSAHADTRVLVQSCPDGGRDFRAEQCAEFDGTDFQGQRYRWLPYYAGKQRRPNL